MFMGFFKEKRCEKRTDGCDAEMEWTYFNRQEGTKSRLLNFSHSGGCIESPLEAKAPSTVLLRLKRCSTKTGEAPAQEVVRNTALAAVKWCRSLPGEKAARYAIGLKYVDWY
jgi:hypothetical protein